MSMFIRIRLVPPRSFTPLVTFRVRISTLNARNVIRDLRLTLASALEVVSQVPGYVDLLHPQLSVPNKHVPVQLRCVDSGSDARS